METCRGRERPLEAARQITGMPDARLVELLLGQQLAVTDGRVHAAGSVQELGLGTTQLAAAVRAGELLKIADGIYLAPGADDDAAERLRGLPSPFTLSQARQALDTTRRIAIPIMEMLSRRGISRQLPDGTHELV